MILLLPAFLHAQHALIPAPVRAAIQPGAFHIDEETEVLYDVDSMDVRAVAEDICERIGRVSSFRPSARLHTGTTIPRNSILLSLREATENMLPEGYVLRIAPNGARITASSAAGMFYAVQTMRQLLPARFESTAGRDTVRGWDATCCLIVDAPRFAWRGLMLDCARHFLDVDFIKHTLDVMALLKLNRLHWHLSDDQGWRLEIKRYPALTSVGAWRTEADGRRYGGYYTQQQVRDIVAYAAARNITVVPEIDMPGHMRAAIAAYPVLSCTQERLEVPHTWGVFKDVLCPGRDETLTFMDDVLDEVMALFPSQWIHLGGDEVPPDRWEACSRCRARMENEGLQDVHALQSWFMTRMAGTLAAQGRRMIGWDEILSGPLAPDAVVQCWRSIDSATAAVERGHDVIVSPTSHAYFDYPLSRIDMERVYAFDPIPTDLKPSKQGHILGGEAEMWTERAPQDRIERRLYPRLLAMAEVLWTAELQRNFSNFRDRVTKYYPRLDSLGIRYGFETLPVQLLPSYDSSGVITFDTKTRQGGLQLQCLEFQSNGSVREVATPFIATGAGEVGAMARKNDRLQSDTLRLCYDAHEAMLARVQYSRPYSPHYTGGGDSALVDGILGSVDHRDGHWQGFTGGDMVIDIRLDPPRSVHELQLGFLQHTRAGILPPDSVEAEIRFAAGSRDDNDTRVVLTLPLRSAAADRKGETPRRLVYSLEGDTGEDRIRPGSDSRFDHIRLSIKAPKSLPAWHRNNGGTAWLFIDECVLH
ncbi:beta-N-acetylhexosaminidase [bacterium]|nr:beta-N-acetylhexosaminidase [bacterium]